MDDEVERRAERLYAEWVASREGPMPAWDDLPERARADFRHEARAALLLESEGGT